MIKEIMTDIEFLKQPCEPATAEDTQVVQDLMDTMESMEGQCACLAANQIGVAKAIVVYEDNDKLYAMYNPVLKKGFIPYKTKEGCFSLKFESEVRRYKRAIISYQVLQDGELVDRERKFVDWTAEIIQHGIDHCNGVLV